MRSSRLIPVFMFSALLFMAHLVPSAYGWSRPPSSEDTAASLASATTSAEDWPFPCDPESLPTYTAYFTPSPIEIDGRLDEQSWQQAPWSNRFVDLVSGEDPIHDTFVKIIWDEENMYVGFWLEEPVIEGRFTERNDPLYYENNAEVFIAGRDAYYEFEINALGTHYEAFFMWNDTYDEGGFAEESIFTRENSTFQGFNGVGWTVHPRGRRVMTRDFWFPGLESAVYIDGELNNPEVRDRGWFVELKFPWKGMEWLAKADNRSLPPEDGDVWRMDFSRFNPYKAAPPANDSGGWSMSSHSVWDSHIPECWPHIIFSQTPVQQAAR